MPARASVRLILVAGNLPLRPPLLGLLAQLLFRLLFQPVEPPLDAADVSILFVVAEELDPVLQRVVQLPFSLLALPLAHLLELRGRKLLVDLGVLERQKHLLDAAHVGRAVLGEAACDVGARGVDAGKELVRAAGAVGAAVRGDVVNGAVDGNVDRLVLVRAVKSSEFLGRDP